jgi:hypothetical protein
MASLVLLRQPSRCERCQSAHDPLSLRGCTSTSRISPSLSTARQSQSRLPPITKAIVAVAAIEPVVTGDAEERVDPGSAHDLIGPQAPDHEIVAWFEVCARGDEAHRRAHAGPNDTLIRGRSGAAAVVANWTEAVYGGGSPQPENIKAV